LLILIITHATDRIIWSKIFGFLKKFKTKTWGDFMKRTVYLITVLMLFSFLIFAQQATDTINELSFSGELSLTLQPGESFTVNHEITEEQLAHLPAIGFYNAENPFDEGIIIKSSMVFETNGQTLFYAPEQEGRYNMVLFSENEMLTEPITFDVLHRQVSTKIILNSLQATAEEYLSVSFEGAPGNQYDWIGVYKPDADPIDYIYSAYLYGETEGSVDIFMPYEPGEYILRMFEDNSYTIIAQSEIFQVVEETTMTIPDSTQTAVFNTVLEVNVDGAFAGEQITVSYTGAPGNETDWIGLYEVGDTQGYIIDWQYTDGTQEGSLDFFAPEEPGNYVFRFFPNDTFDIIAESYPIAVLDVETTNPEFADEKVMVREAVFCESVDADYPVNEKIDFSFKDDTCYLWMNLGPFKGPHEGKWEWYYPDGQLYDTVYLDIPSAYERGLISFDSLSLWSWIPLKGQEEQQSGIWKVYFYIDEELVFAQQFFVEKPTLSNRPIIETTEKSIQIGEISLNIPTDAQWFIDTFNPDLYYIELDSKAGSYPFIGIQFSTEEIIYEDGQQYRHESDTIIFEGYDYLSYDEEYDITDRVIDLKMVDQNDSDGNMIFIFFVCQEEDFSTWENTWIDILNSIKITQ